MTVNFVDVAISIHDASPDDPTKFEMNLVFSIFN